MAANKYAIVDRLPSDIAQKVRGEVPYYLGADGRYLVFGLQHHAADLESGALAKKKTEPIYVHNRSSDKWVVLSIEGSCSRPRMFGTWLATIVQFWGPNHEENPGIEHERSVETEDLPDVQGLYAASAGRNCFIPGELRLLNLDTRQKIAWHTGEEDSEILWVGDTKVLYRVNDTIYQAKIVGDKIQDPSVAVKDDDVPEIHWVFWSK